MTQLAEAARTSLALKEPRARLEVTMLIFATLAIAVDGFANQILALSVPALMHAWHVTRADFAPATALGLVGMSVGAVAAGSIGDRIGAKIALLTSIFIFAVATSLTFYARDLQTLDILRGLAGLGLGGAVPNASSLVAAHTPSARRSLAVTIANSGVPIGGLVAGLVGAVVLSLYGWPNLFLLGGVLSALVGLTLWVSLPNNLPQTNNDAAKSTAPSKAKWAELLSIDYRRDTLAMSFAFFFTFLSIYTVINWLPAFLGAQGYPLSLTSSGLGIFNLGGLVGGIATAAIIGFIGSRIPMLAAAGAAVLCAAGLAAAHAAVPGGAPSLLVVLAFLGALLGGVQTTLFALAANLFPAALRASGIGFALGVGRIGAMFSAFTGGRALGLPLAVSFFAAISLAMIGSFICLAIVERHVPRPSGRVV